LDLKAPFSHQKTPAQGSAAQTICSLLQDRPPAVVDPGCTSGCRRETPMNQRFPGPGWRRRATAKTGFGAIFLLALF